MHVKSCFDRFDVQKKGCLDREDFMQGCAHLGKQLTEEECDRWIEEADVDGNGTKDLLINDKGYGNNLSNAIGVGLASPSSSEFTFVRVAQTLAPAEDWSQYVVRVGDFNNDDRDDVLWISSAATNSVYLALAKGD